MHIAAFEKFPAPPLAHTAPTGRLDTTASARRQLEPPVSRVTVVPSLTLC